MKLKAYYTDLVDRAVKSAAQASVLALGADQLNVLDADWKVVGGFAAGAAALSVLTNLGQRGLFGRDA